jgi:hypothetical protein
MAIYFCSGQREREAEEVVKGELITGVELEKICEVC